MTLIEEIRSLAALHHEAVERYKHTRVGNNPRTPDERRAAAVELHVAEAEVSRLYHALEAAKSAYAHAGNVADNVAPDTGETS